ncbi:MAG: methyltransferase domain-containing protein [Acidobacteriota bacterium]
MMPIEERQRLANESPKWMYEFDLGDGIVTPLLAEELRTIHDTRERMIFSRLDVLLPSLEGLRCLDAGCNEGFFAQQLYQRGAAVDALDIRDVNIRRAKAVREICGLDPARLRFSTRDFFDLKAEPETYDVSLFLGLLYHLENPMGALRLLHRITRDVAVIETQFTRQQSAIESGWGQTGIYHQLEASCGLMLEEDAHANRLASHKVLSFVPNPAAVRLMLEAAGFTRIEQLEPEAGMNPQYLGNDRGIFFAFKQS